MTKRNQHKPEFKARVALEALKGEQTVAELASLRLREFHLAASELFPSSRLHYGAGAACGLPGSWGQAGNGTLGAAGQSVHAAVRAGGLDPVREMPLLAAVRFMGITDKRLWRIVEHYVRRPVIALDLRLVRSVWLDETASKRGHNFVAVFIDMDRGSKRFCIGLPGVM